MPKNLQEVVQDIFREGVRAVGPDRLFQDKISLSEMHVLGVNQGGETVDLAYLESLKQGGSLVVVGAGKAAAQMALAFEETVIRPMKEQCPDLSVKGWINSPEGVVSQTQTESGIELFPARPAGRNSPTEACVEGTKRIVQLLRDSHEDDVVLCLLSGGGSALLTLPIDGVTLEDMQAVAQLLAAAGANIEQLNGLRQCLSQVKGGGLARACNASQLCTLVISDVLGDSLATIASGPTFVDVKPSPEAAIRTLEELELLEHPKLERVRSALTAQAAVNQPASVSSPAQPAAAKNLILGSNRDAVAAAAKRAKELGYECLSSSAPSSEPEVGVLAAQIAVEFLEKANQANRPICWVHGGEPTVRLPANPGRGGRNQQLTGEVLKIWSKQLRQPTDSSLKASELAFLSGGTDGEDGPTDAAGACFGPNSEGSTLCHRIYETAGNSTTDKMETAPSLSELQDHLDRASTYDFFEKHGGLLKTGQTGTNVCDLRIMVYHPDF